MKHLFLLITAVLLINSCKPRLNLQPSTSETKTIIDSIFVETKTIDTLVIHRPADTVFIKIPIANLTAKRIVKRSNHAKLTVRKVDSILVAECVTDSLTSVIKQQQKTITKLRATTTAKNTTVIVPERYIPTLLKPLIWIGGLVLVILLGGIAIRLLKPKWL